MGVIKRQIAQFLKINAQDAIAIRERPAADADKSYSGGYPLLPKTLPWPLDPQGNECVFLAQIDLAELPVRPEHCPATGLLYVFLNAALEDCDDKPTSDPFLYYATADQDFELRKPSKPLNSATYFWYRGDRPGPGSYGRDALPKSGWDFAVFSDHNYPGGGHQHRKKRLLLTTAERESLSKVKATPLEIAEEVWNHTKESRASVRNELSDSPFFGGFEHIDPHFKIRATWWGRAYVYEKTNVPMHPFFAEWPQSPEVIFNHAKKIAFSGGDFSPERDNDVDDFARQITAEALEWVKWAKERASPDMSLEDKDNYRSWCRSSFARCFEAARPGVFDAPRVWKRFLGLRNRLYQLLPSKWRNDRKTARSAHMRRLKAVEEIYSPTVLAVGPPQPGRNLGQLMGYGESIQEEVNLHRNKILVFQCYDLPHLSFGGGDFKLWLASRTLKPNAWQHVVAINAVS